MSSPKYNPSSFRHDRLLEAVAARGLNGAALTLRINTIRREQDKTARITDPSTIARWLRGDRDPSMTRPGCTPGVFDLADALQVSVDWLMGRVDAPSGLKRRLT